MSTSKNNLHIRPLPTSKDKIKQPKLAASDDMYIPPLGSSVIISGKSGSGKSTLLANLLKEKRFYDGWFDKTFIFSPTANGDDVQRSLNIPSKYVFTDLSEAPELLQVILKSQQQKLDGGDKAHTAPQYAIIFDDVIGDTKFMNTPEFTKCFYQVRHVNCTTFICTQHFKRVPRVCRLQANFIFFFQGSQSEVDTVVDEFAPPMYSRREFTQLVHDATREDFSFLTINMKVGWEKRFRRNLDTFIPLKKLYEHEDILDPEDSNTSEESDEESEEEKSLVEEKNDASSKQT